MTALQKLRGGVRGILDWHFFSTFGRRKKPGEAVHAWIRWNRVVPRSSMLFPHERASIVLGSQSESSQTGSLVRTTTSTAVRLCPSCSKCRASSSCRHSSARQTPSRPVGLQHGDSRRSRSGARASAGGGTLVCVDSPRGVILGTLVGTDESVQEDERSLWDVAP